MTAPQEVAFPRRPTLVTPTRGQLLDWGDPPRRLIIPRWMMLLMAVGAQSVLTRAMIGTPRLGLVQLVAIMGVTGFAILKRDAVIAMYVLAYLPCAEIVWRQTGAPVPYQIAPYATGAIAILLILTMFDRLTKPGRTAIFYVLLLIPSTIVTISVAGDGARELIAFALSGPVAMAALVVLFSQITIEPWLYRRILWIMLISGMGPLMAAITSIDQYVAANGALEFDSESNFVTSGGFGPVQVSSLMGLTVLCAVLVFLVEKEGGARVLAVGIGFLATVLSFLTFSRGGMTATALALAMFALSQARDPRTRTRVLSVVVVVFILGYFVIIPRINTFTQGAFEERFSDTSSGRTELATNDLEVFKNHVGFGVGPGMTRYNRVPYDICLLRSDKCAKEGSSHTEFTRMLGEHGIPGLIAIVLLISLLVQAVARAGPSRPITLTFLTWAVAQMFYANFRVVGIAFAFGFAFIRIAERPPDPVEELPATPVAPRLV